MLLFCYSIRFSGWGSFSGAAFSPLQDWVATRGTAPGVSIVSGVSRWRSWARQGLSGSVSFMLSVVTCLRLDLRCHLIFQGLASQRDGGGSFTKGSAVSIYSVTEICVGVVRA